MLNRKDTCIGCYGNILNETGALKGKEQPEKLHSVTSSISTQMAHAHWWEQREHARVIIVSLTVTVDVRSALELSHCVQLMVIILLCQISVR